MNTICQKIYFQGFMIMRPVVILKKKYVDIYNRNFYQISFYLYLSNNLNYSTILIITYFRACWNILSRDKKFCFWIIYFKIIIITIKRGWQCKAGRERLTPYQSEDPNPITPTHRKKEEKVKTVEDKTGASS